MKKVILTPDSFKGTMSSQTVCDLMEKSVRRRYPGCEVIKIPVADGGEGTVDCFLQAVGGEKCLVSVSGPRMEKREAFYGILKDEAKSAVIEMAACAGLPLVEGQENPEETYTYGVGELILAALDRGCRRLILGLGGSCTNDGGCGMAAALGAAFYDREGKTFVPNGGTLERIERIDLSGLDRRLQECDIIAMCDIDNPLYGPRGAAFVFGPQKGADEAMVRRLDAGLMHLSARIKADLGRDISVLPGAGAAGGMGGGAAAFLHARLQNGIEVVLDTVNFDDRLSGTDAVFTGEGRLDEQSLMGKVVGGIAQRTRKQKVPLIVVAGSVEENAGDIFDSGVSAAFSINQKPLPFEEAKKYSEENLLRTMENILRLTTVFGAAR